MSTNCKPSAGSLLLLVSDLRTTYAEALYAMDASPDDAGLCSAPLPGNVVKELRRFSEQKGFYTRLVAPAAATLLELPGEPLNVLSLFFWLQTNIQLDIFAQETTSRFLGVVNLFICPRQTMVPMALP